LSRKKQARRYVYVYARSYILPHLQKFNVLVERSQFSEGEGRKKSTCSRQKKKEREKKKQKKQKEFLKRKK
jgi:hypothetical protein